MSLMRFDRTVVLVARWLAYAAMLANAALPVLAHAHGLQRFDATGRAQVCAGGELRWVRVDADRRIAGSTDPLPGERSTAAEASACPVCATSAGHDAMPSAGARPVAVLDTCTLGTAAPDASSREHERWLAAAARAPPSLLVS
jgi:Protein of unknown function (DUF2946)